MKSLVKRIIWLLIFTLILGFVQWFVIQSIQVKSFYSTFEIYTFHFLVTLSIIVGMHIFYYRCKKQIWHIFLASSAFRILLSIGFFVPSIIVDDSDKKTDILAFMFPYFMFLMFVIQSTVQLLNDKKYTFDE